LRKFCSSIKLFVVIEPLPLPKKERYMATTIAKPVKPATSAKKKSPAATIVSVSEIILNKLKDLKLEPGLQSEITWCLGSYHHDQNPIGLFEKATLALEVFKSAQAKKTKGVTAKLIADIEKVLATK
jgi:hypothetical protein